MKSVAERPPILTIHEDQGDYILRVSDARYRPLVVGVSHLLPGARRLIVVTPGDVKFFVMEGADSDDLPADADADLRGTGADGGADGTGAPVADVDPALIAEQESHAIPNAEPDAEPSAPDAPPKLTRKRKPLRQDVKVGHDENCQRCGGTGKAYVRMPDNSTAESACPICQGVGVIKRYGVRR